MDTLEIVVNKTSKHPAFLQYLQMHIHKIYVTNVGSYSSYHPVLTSFSHWMKYETDVSLIH